MRKFVHSRIIEFEECASPANDEQFPKTPGKGSASGKRAKRAYYDIPCQFQQANTATLNFVA